MLDDFKTLFHRVKQSPELVPAEGSNGMLENHQKMNQKTDIIAIVNQKGGCGKTTTCINLAAGLARSGFRVLIIDLDSQANASLGIGIPIDQISVSIYDVLVKNLELEQTIIPTTVPNLDISPAVSLLTGAQLEIADQLGREGLLKTSIRRMTDTAARRYDYIFLDNSPSLNLITINGLVAAKSVLIPIQAHYFSLEGMRELFNTIHIVRERLNSQMQILGILPTLIDLRSTMTRDILGQIQDYFKEKMFRTMIRNNIRLAEATAHGKCIFEFDGECKGADDYRSLTEEVMFLTRPEHCRAEFKQRSEEKSGLNVDPTP